MFTMHYAFESEEKVRMMLRNVAGCLKKGGRFLGVVPNSDVSAEKIREWYATKNKKEKESTTDTTDTITITSTTAQTPKEDDGETEDGPSWGNSIYNVRFPTDPHRPLAPDGQFRPPFSWKYTYWMAEAVDVPEFVVPWEAFRAMAESFNLEQRYRKPFPEVFESEKGNREMMALAGRMGVTKQGRAVDNGAGGIDGGLELRMSPEELEAVGFYHAFCFVKV
jgi:mRNA (guanine-N7-)-methyltransferase